MSCYFYQGTLKFKKFKFARNTINIRTDYIVDQASQLYYEIRNFTQY